MSDKYTCNGWCCTDCLMEIANGESPVDLTEEQAAERDAGIAERNAGYNITLGMLAQKIYFPNMPPVPKSPPKAMLDQGVAPAMGMTGPWGGPEEK